jgi:molecular chaperone DnaK (HSP70)
MKWQGTSETGYTPTTLLYFPADGGSGPRYWGYKVAKSQNRKDIPEDAYEIRLAKLLLHEARETRQETLRLKEIAQSHGKEDIDFIRDFLHQLHNFLLGEYGYFQQHHSPWLVNTDIEFIIGVPAAWSEPEQQTMIQAAIEAGFENPSRGSEPEAMAAIYFAQHETSLEVISCISIIIDRL